MKFFCTLSKTIFFLALAAAITTYGLIFYLQDTVSHEYKITRGETLHIDAPVPVTAEYDGTRLSRAQLGERVGENFSVDLKLFGAIPFSSVDVEVVDEMYVATLGSPFGMKLYTDGVLIIETSEVITKDGTVNPSKIAGLKIGDYILSVNGEKITCNEDLSEIVSDSAGKTVELLIKRGSTKKKIKIKPALSSENDMWRLGIWVRDSCAGIGTLTFYSPSTGVLCGLGHGICDEDTDSLLFLESGQMIGAEILSVKRGESGAPGELKGRFLNDVLAPIAENDISGVFGVLNGKISVSELTEIALKQEIKNGKAQILCTVDGKTPQMYDCEIKKRTSNYHSKTQNFTVTVTDPQLLELTGGIVQGMSGSPILQNGRLIGAITHVLVDDPTTGYAIFAENMLETAQSVANENKLKDVS